MAMGAPKDITQCRRFFEEPGQPRQRMYEALRAYFLEGLSSQVVARSFGYTPGAFRVLCHQFRRDPDPRFFVEPAHGPRTQPKKAAAHDLVVALRKQNHSVYEIAEALKERQMALSPTAVREVLRAEGFASLPRRMDEERPAHLGPTLEPVADVRAFTLAPGTQFTTRCGGLFLFLPELVRLQVDALAHAARLPGSAMIPAAHALRAALALKLWSIERKSHVMALVADPGLALFCGLNAIPKKSYLCEYSSRVDHARTTGLLAAWHRAVAQDPLFGGESFNLDFHSVPYYGEDPQLERHYVSMRSRAQPSVLAFLAQDAAGRAFCYSNADLRKGEEAEEIFRFIAFWKKHHGENPRHLVFDSRLGAAPTRMSPRASSKRHACSNSLSSWPGRPSDNSLCSTWVTKSRPFCSPTIAMAPPPNCSPVTPSACSSRTHCPMPCASSTWTRYLRPSASRSISIWPCWSSPVACIVSSPSPCAATPMPRPVTSFVISSTHRLTSLFPNAKFTCVSTAVPTCPSSSLPLCSNPQCRSLGGKTTRFA